MPLADGNAPYRICLLKSQSGYALGQRCVEVCWETVPCVAWPPQPVERALFVFSARRLFYDAYGSLAPPGQPAEAARAPEVPYVSSSHGHRHLRGNVLVEGSWQKLSTASATYAPALAALLGRLWSQALSRLDRSSLRGGDETAFAARSELAFTVVMPPNKSLSAMVAPAAGRGREDGGAASVLAEPAKIASAEGRGPEGKSETELEEKLLDDLAASGGDPSTEDLRAAPCWRSA